MLKQKNVRRIVVVVIAVFALTLIAYPLFFSPKTLEPGVDGTDVQIEPIEPAEPNL